MSDVNAAAATRQQHASADPGARGNKWWTLVAVCLGTFMLLLDITIVNVALPDIQLALHSSFSDLQWIVDAYALTLAAFLLTAGSLADMYGRRLLYLIGLVVFTAASVLCGFAVNTLMLQLSRGLQGVGGAIMFAVSLALLADAFRGKDRGVAFGVWGAITGLAVAIGPLLGGMLTSGLSWRWIFFVNAPDRRLRRRHHHHAGGRVARPAGQPTGLGGLRPVHRRAGEPGLRPDRVEPRSRSPTAWCSAASRPPPCCWSRSSWSSCGSKHPMFDLSLFRLPTFSGGLVAAFGLSASIFSMLLYLVLYLQDILGYSALGTGVRLMVISGGILVTATVSGRLTLARAGAAADRPGPALGRRGLLLMRGLDATSSWTHLIPGMIVGGLAVGLVNPPLASTAVGVVDAAAGRHGLGHQLHIPPGRDRHRHRPAGHAVLQQGARRGDRQGERGARAVRSRRRRSRPRCSRGRSASVLSRLPRTVPGGQVGGIPGPLSPGPEPDSAGGRHHRAGVGRDVAGRHPDEGLRPAAAGAEAPPASAPGLALPTVTACANTSSWASRAAARARRAPCSRAISIWCTSPSVTSSAGTSSTTPSSARRCGARWRPANWSAMTSPRAW